MKPTYIATSTGLKVLYKNNATPAASMLADVTSTYSSGIQMGDIRRCFLANSQTADRSVKAATLTVVGTPTETVNAGGRNVYSGFSAANYFQEASHADWNALGTGDFSIIMSGVKWGTAGGVRSLFCIDDSATNGGVHIRLTATGIIQVGTRTAPTTVTPLLSTTATFTDTAEHTLCIRRLSGILYIEVDGVICASVADSTSISLAAGGIFVGQSASLSLAWTGGQVACVRISATAPTAEQSKFIAAQENALNGGATCVLSNSSSVSALNYHADNDLLEVVNGTATDYFTGLKRVASVTTTSGITGGNNVPRMALLRSGTTNKFWAAERDINAELTEQFPVVKKTQQYSFTSSGTTQALSVGWKAQNVAFNTTDGTVLNVATTQTFDGFKYTLTGLTTAKAYLVSLIEV